MFMICSSVINHSKDVKPQGNGCKGDKGTPSLDMGDVAD